ncbi:phenylalanine ammonia-lyase [Mytilinidion resinicola]|uniref:Phenylalanine ammonia-lyase n=1 Tax=Mytilinidion resinicola TaxID=574789 RepID=A0A6A6YZF5_9PEZI|nr:phenylalanine ammonia-lyase [Mytilinidion resinicola]KAF2813879.1 phenylalanine ammonia-lyase [Mytilinidion resinicola]
MRIQDRNPIVVDGSSLEIASIVAVSRYGISGILDPHPAVKARIDDSVRFLDNYLREGHTVYGINTGFGGSADVRTTNHGELQRALLQMQHSGVLPRGNPLSGTDQAAVFTSALQPDVFSSLALPEPWVRATMLVRCNTLSRGHSAVRPQIIEHLLKLLELNCIPLVPLRGSISASGDLSPLSYLAGALEGNPGIYVWNETDECLAQQRLPIPASETLKKIGIAPTSFKPKEALALVNGTAVSAAVASLALHDLNNLLAFGQVLAAMGVEAILGTAESFFPFISDVRPHRGQKEVAGNILAMLSGTKLASGVAGSSPAAATGLFQDRYSVRTVPQWLGPFLEDLMLAHEQLSIECNSTTDNPLIDAQGGTIYHGGNFQAVAVTCAIEKSRIAAQAIGRMLFAQCTELLNPNTNRGLPPSLCADDPSTSFTMKGVDINMAAYMSELSFLANPVHNHVQNAEMGNQALNSLALISARYTHTAVELLSLMSATYLYVLCQALDLRAMHVIFLETWKSNLEALTRTNFEDILDKHTVERLVSLIWTHVSQEFVKTSIMDLSNRFKNIMTSSQTIVLTGFQEATVGNTMESPELNAKLLKAVHSFRIQATEQGEFAFESIRSQYLRGPDATPYLGAASKRMYIFVRRELKVPIHRGVIDHPTPVADPSGISPAPSKEPKDNVDKKTTGGWISIIYDALRTGSLIEQVVECLKEATQHPGALVK